MATVQKRIAILEARCSPPARRFLRELRGHPEFAELVNKLETIAGTLLERDVEAAFVAIAKRTSDLH